MGRLSISRAVSLAQNAVEKLNTDIAAGKLSKNIRDALQDNFNRGKAAGAVNVALATRVRNTLRNTRTDLLMRSDIECGAVGSCVASPVCSRFVSAHTLAIAGATVHLCPAFFRCESSANGRASTVLHEFVHHTGVSNPNEIYRHDGGFNNLTPIGDGSALDSLDHADTYTRFAETVW